MKGIFVNCGNKECTKMLLKNVYLRAGSFLTVKCFHCGCSNEVVCQAGRINIKVFGKPVEKQNLTDEEDDDIVMLNV